MTAVVSYWFGESGETQVWLYENEEKAIEGMNRLWKQSYNLALEDDDLDEFNSYYRDDIAVVAWLDGLFRYFEVVALSETDGILQKMEVDVHENNY